MPYLPCTRWIRPIALALLAIICTLSASAQRPAPEPQAVTFEGKAWELVGDGEVSRALGREALTLRSGRALLRDLDMKDGTVEVDVAVTDYRSFVYVQFRMVSDGEYEDLYLRPHKSRLVDAVQYSPVHFGRSAWQLFHRKDATGPAVFRAGTWQRLKIAVSGERAVIYMSHQDDEDPQKQVPVLIIPRLARKPAAGYIALRAFLPRGDGPPGLPVARFSNVRAHPGELPADFENHFAPGGDAPEPARAVEGAVRSFRLSKVFDAPDGPLEELPPEIVGGKWSQARTEASGLLHIGALLDRPRSGGTVLARLDLRAERAGARRLDLGFSDRISVFLNGRLLYAADASYSRNLPRRQGLITPDQTLLYLPLEKGDNELTFAVSEIFGGWGLMVSFPDRTGLVVR